MTDQELNEAVARKLGNGPCDPGGYSLARDQHNIVRCTYCGKEVAFENPEHIQQKNYCHSIAAAWEIIEKMQTQFDYVEIICANKANNGKWSCRARKSTIWETWESADTAPRAICLAVLKLGEK